MLELRMALVIASDPARIESLWRSLRRSGRPYLVVGHEAGPASSSRLATRERMAHVYRPKETQLLGGG